ncbi:MAG: hypothetical protein ACOCUV_01465 [bacterium]
MRSTFFYFLISVMAGMLISSCEKDDDIKTQNDDNTASEFGGTTWHYETSAGFNDETTKVKGTLAFLSSDKFTYSEEYVEKSPSVTIELADSIEGTYSYSGSPNVDSNLVFTYTNTSGVETKNYARYVNDSTMDIELIWLTIDGITRELSRK